MDRLILKICISVSIILTIFLIYLGTTDFMVNPKVVDSEYVID